ncbi:MAG: hypothetical protein GXN93_05420 [Candidatus Diapherotrites archaeon]|nr:hypothetical protein [Candidatus Diapherotrites archaeon]
MNRTILPALAMIFVISGAFALSLQVQTIPGVLTPGTTGKIIFYITATTPGAHDIQIEVKPGNTFSIENADTRVDVGDDLGGTISYAMQFAVPDDTKPGTYVLPVTIYYDDPTTGKIYEEHFAPLLTVTSGKGLDVSVAESKVYADNETTLKIIISNTGDPIYNARVTVPVALGDTTKYVGTLTSGASKDIYVTILPECAGGIYQIPIIVSGYRGTEPFQEEFNYSVKCIPPQNDIRVEMNIPRTVSGGEQNTILTITNLTSVASGPIAVSLSGVNVKLGGQTDYYINSLPPQGHISIPVVWKLARSDEEGQILVTVTTAMGKRVYGYAIMPNAAPDIHVYPSSVKWSGNKLDVSLTVANVGTGTAETVFVAAEGNAEGQTVIGDLSPGDYDNADVYISPSGKTAKFSVDVSYIVDGQKKLVQKTITVNVPEKPKSYGLWIVLALIVAGAIWWWRKKR